MAMGLPVIAYDSGGIREQILVGKTGYLVRTAPELVMRVKTLLTDRKRLQSMSLQTRQRARAKFSMKESATHFSEVLPI